MEPPEIVIVDSHTTSCDGGGGPLGHPRVYLNLERHGAVDCPYCGRQFVLRGRSGTDAAGAGSDPRPSRGH